jgi:hypothetical protein
MYVGLHVKYPLPISYVNETEIFQIIFEKNYSNNSNIKFNHILSSVSQAVPCGQTEGQTYMTKTMTIVYIQNYLKVPKKRKENTKGNIYICI